MVKISFLGACREVGRSAVLIESKGGTKCMLDYGVRFHEDNRLPFEADLTGLKAVALTHCHVDHSGAIPLLYRNGNLAFFTNPVTLAITKILLKDMLRISNYNYPFGYAELKKMIKNSRFLQNNYRQKIGNDFYITYFNAGHIPGSISILVEVDGKNIIYTGDINTKETNLVNALDSNDSIGKKRLDALIIESTYAIKKHSPREELEKQLIEKIIDTISNGGRVLIPAFGVARSQEALLILEKYNYRGKIFLDGMARKVSRIYLEHLNSLKNKTLYKNAIKKAQFISRRRMRDYAKKANGVIIAPSGMLKGGASINYGKTLARDPLSAIYLVGYQVEGTPGRGLIDDGILEFHENDQRRNFINDFKIKAQCDYAYFDFSSHSDGPQLRQYIDGLKFKDETGNIFCVHGEEEAATKLASELVKKNHNSVAPETGETYII
ncbi:MAG: MBL fold metallo-hydrolase [Candidatus Lokiarchaeota archaeon]|nr:MBL fold metallo-hydrolase [Candidatus Lokiarchaeota archaeon]MBD3340338.1 MBL fold metallo-hydrolase [Candidatus Lokiarchaeota archaeon]